MGGGGSSKQSSNTQPWKAQQPFLKDIYSTAEQISNVPLSYYPTSTVAAQSGQTQDYYDAATQRAQGGNPLLKQAQGYTSDVLAGNFLNSNPHLQANYDAGAEAITRNYRTTVAPERDTQIYGANRQRSGAQGNAQYQTERALGSELSNLWERMGFQDYGRERGYQNQAAGAAAGLAREDYYDISQLQQVGQQRDQYQQTLLDDLVRRFEFNQNEPYNRAGQYSNLIGQPVSTSQSRASSWDFNICHGTAEYFGWYTAGWWQAADWITKLWPEADEAGRVFLAWYRKNSRQLARAIREDEELREAWRPFFLWARKRGAEAGS